MSNKNKNKNIVYSDEVAFFDIETSKIKYHDEEGFELKNPIPQVYLCNVVLIKKEYLNNVEKKVLEVNTRLQPHIAKMVAKYYQRLLNKDYMDITVLEALIYELQRLEYNTEFKEENNNLVCNLKGKVR